MNNFCQSEICHRQNNPPTVITAAAATSANSSVSFCLTGWLSRGILILWWTTFIHSFIMVALWNRADHYIFILSFVLFLSFFFFSSPNLSRRRVDVCHTCNAHMVWPYCEFKMQVWNVLHAARWKYRTQNSRQKSPSGHHCTTLSGYIFTTKPRIDNRKKLVKQQYVLHMSS